MTAELGYSSFAAHGGDWGSTVTEHIGRSHSRSVIGIHLTDVPSWHIFEKPKDLSAAEQTYLERNARRQRKEGAYAMIQGTRPRTLGAGLRDSPVGLAAWLVEKFQRWSDCGEDLERRYTKDELLTNVMIYWATGTIESSFQPYRDVVSAGAMRWMTEGVKKLLGSQATPAGFALFPKDISDPPREWAERFFKRGALDGDASGRPLRRTRGAAAPGRGHPRVLPARASPSLLNPSSPTQPLEKGMVVSSRRPDGLIRTAGRTGPRMGSGPWSVPGARRGGPEARGLPARDRPHRGRSSATTRSTAG
jgi:hypothetical protein